MCHKKGWAALSYPTQRASKQHHNWQASPRAEHALPVGRVTPSVPHKHNPTCWTPTPPRHTVARHAACATVLSSTVQNSKQSKRSHGKTSTTAQQQQQPTNRTYLWQYQGKMLTRAGLNNEHTRRDNAHGMCAAHLLGSTLAAGDHHRVVQK